MYASTCERWRGRRVDGAIAWAASALGRANPASARPNRFVSFTIADANYA